MRTTGFHMQFGLACCGHLASAVVARAEPVGGTQSVSGCTPATGCQIARVQIPYGPWLSGYIDGGAGYAVALAGDRLVLSAPFAQDSAECPGGCGAVELLRWEGAAWISEFRINPNAIGGGFTGFRLALSDDYLAVGQPRFDCESAGSCGGVRVFRRDGFQWIFASTIASPDPEVFGEFGNALAFDGEDLIVGAGATDAGATNAGATYVFRRADASWLHVQTLTPPTPHPGAWFGDSLAVSGDWLVVGAPRTDCNAATDCGAAHMFVRTPEGTWTYSQELRAEDPVASARFGAAVALSGDLLAIGSPAARVGEVPAAGAVYLFEREGGAWVQRTQLAAPNPTFGEWFGTSVAVNAHSIVIGSPRTACERGSSCGAVYVFRRSLGAWGYSETILPTIRSSFASFGAAVVSNDRWTIVGSPGDISSTSDDATGAAYVYVRSGTDCGCNNIDDVCECLSGAALDCNVNLRPDGCDVALGESADCTGDGIPDECQFDCQPNGVADVCDLASGASSDHNADDRPDECGTADSCYLEAIVGLNYAGAGYFGRRVAVGDELAAMTGCATYVGFPCHRQSVLLVRRIGMQWAGGLEFAGPANRTTSEFGDGLAVDGSSAIVGDPGAFHTLDVGRGAVFVLTESGGGWHTAEIHAPNELTERFGAAVARRGDHLFVGAPEADGASFIPNSGSVYLFHLVDNAWEPLDVLAPPEPVASQHFGASLAVDGDRLLVGAPGTSCISATGGCGAAFVFLWDGETWVRDADLRAVRAGPTDRLGAVVAVSGRYAAVSARDPAQSCEPRPCGGVALFAEQAGTWSQTGWLQPTEADGAYAEFGQAVAMDWPWLAVGVASSSCLTDHPCGEVLLYSATTVGWTEVRRFHNEEFPGGTGSEFGRAVALHDGLLLAGAPNRSCGEGLPCGAAMLVQIGGDDCDLDAVSDACEIGLGTSADVDRDRRLDRCQADADQDGDADLVDVGRFFRCFHAPEPLPPECHAADTNGDMAVSLADVSVLVAGLIGPE